MWIGDSRDLQDVLNIVCQEAARECESREHDGSLRGNGHHMAQKITTAVEEALIERGLFLKLADPSHGSPFEQRAKAFLTEVQTLMIEALKLSPEATPKIFAEVAGLTRTLQRLFSEQADHTERATKLAIRERFGKFVEGL